MNRHEPRKLIEGPHLGLLFDFTHLNFCFSIIAYFSHFYWRERNKVITALAFNLLISCGMWYRVRDTKGNKLSYRVRAPSIETPGIEVLPGPDTL
jgi:hypothetical protein